MINYFLTLKGPTLLLMAFATISYMSTTYTPADSALFHIARSKDASTIHYDIRVDNSGNLFGNEPIEIYWIKQRAQLTKEPLTWIQKNYSYGISYLYIYPNEAKFQFVAYKKRDFVLKKNSEGIYKVFTTVNDKDLEVDLIFIQIEGGTFWFPKIPKVELHLTDSENAEKLIEIVYP